MSSIEFQSPIAIKIPIEVDLAGEDQVRDAIGNLQGRRGTKGGRDPLTQKEKLLETFKRDLGVGRGTNAFNFLANPKGGMLSFLKGAGPVLAGIILAYELAPRVAKLLTKRGSVWDLTFRNIAETLNNTLRTRTSQQEILVGFRQVIFTSRAGTIDPRDSYNTYDIKNTEEAEHERAWRIRDPYGV